MNDETFLDSNIVMYATLENKESKHKREKFGESLKRVTLSTT